MSKPWDNEPIFSTILNTHEKLGATHPYIDPDYVANLERRMRAAERLLEKAQDIYGLWGISGVTEHLEAARKEDGR